MTKPNMNMNRTIQAQLTPAADQPRITDMSDEFRTHAELEKDLDKLLALQHAGGNNATSAWELSKSYEERFIELLSIFAPPDGCTAVLGSY